jgi:hypothetical protein
MIQFLRRDGIVLRSGQRFADAMCEVKLECSENMHHCNSRVV